MTRCTIILISALLIACSQHDRETARLASGCINASPDNRVKLSGSWSNSFDVERRGEKFIVRTEVPVGLSLAGKIKFRQREFHCRETENGIEFVRAVWQKGGD